MAKRKIYFRADGNAQIGLGHVVRSLALVEMLQGDFECHFIIRNPLPSLKQQILETCESLIELPETENDENEAVELSQSLLTGKEIVVLDGYHFRTEYQRAIKNKRCNLVCIDDIHAYHFVADIVINHSPHVSESDYSCENYTDLRLGFLYSLIREPFRKKINLNKIKNKNKSVFICFGGSDYANITLKALKAAVLSDDIVSIDVVTGDAYPHLSSIIAVQGENLNKRIKFHKNLSALEISDLMAINQVAIVPASTISFEVFASGIAAVCGFYAENQMKYYEYLAEKNFIIQAGNYNEISVNKLSMLIDEAIKKPPIFQGIMDASIKSRYKNLFKKLR